MTAKVSDSWSADDPRIGEILDIVAKETGVARERLTPSTSIPSLDIASLDMVQAIFAIESHFNVELPIAAGQDGGEFASVGDLVKQVLASIRGERGT